MPNKRTLPPGKQSQKLLTMLQKNIGKAGIEIIIDPKTL